MGKRKNNVKLWLKKQILLKTDISETIIRYVSQPTQLHQRKRNGPGGYHKDYLGLSALFSKSIQFVLR